MVDCCGDGSYCSLEHCVRRTCILSTLLPTVCAQKCYGAKVSVKHGQLNMHGLAAHELTTAPAGQELSEEPSEAAPLGGNTAEGGQAAVSLAARRQQMTHDGRSILQGLDERRLVADSLQTA